MTVVLIESRADPASIGIAAELRRRPEWSETASTFEGARIWRAKGSRDVRLVALDGLHVHAEALDDRLREASLEPELLIFLSKHRSESGRPTLTVHPLGNFGPADIGGRPGRLTPVDGAWLTEALRALRTARDAAHFGADVAFEVTHHGPLLATPAFFLELGSTEPQWNDPRGHAVLADAVAALIARALRPFPIVVGLGGGHYAPRFTEAALTKQVHFAHLVPTYHAKGHTDPSRLGRETAIASPGASHFYYHDGTLPKADRDAWMSALEANGLRRVESREWPALEPGGD